MLFAHPIETIELPQKRMLQRNQPFTSVYYRERIESTRCDSGHDVLCFPMSGRGHFPVFEFAKGAMLL